MQKSFIFFLWFLLSISVFANSKKAQENFVYSMADGWTQTINYKCTTNVNVNNAYIEFSVDKPTGSHFRE